MDEKTSEGTQTRKKGYVPDDDKDYRLSGIEIDDAENGVVVNCRYKLRPEIAKKLESQRSAGLSVPYYDSYSGDKEAHVFQDKAEAKNFISSELDSLFGTGGMSSDGDGDEA